MGEQVSEATLKKGLQPAEQAAEWDKKCEAAGAQGQAGPAPEQSERRAEPMAQRMIYDAARRKLRSQAEASANAPGRPRPEINRATGLERRQRARLGASMEMPRHLALEAPRGSRTRRQAAGEELAAARQLQQQRQRQKQKQKQGERLRASQPADPVVRLKCRVERDLYLDFEEYRQYTCVNCYK